MARIRVAMVVLAGCAVACGGNSRGITVGTTGATGVAVAVATSGSTGSHSTTTGTTGGTGATTGSGSTSSGETTGATTGAASTQAASTGGASTNGAVTSGGSTSASTGGTTSGSTTGSSSGCVPTTEFVTGCGLDSDCDCGLLCVTDPAFGANVNACEYSCAETTDCPNAVSICSDLGLPVDGSSTKTCTLNVCGGLRDNPGDTCDAYGDGGASGTCIPQSRTFSTLDSTPDTLLCVQSGDGTTCAPDVDDEDPEYSNDSTEIGTDLTIASPFSREAAGLCPAGGACNAAFDAGAGPACQSVCSTSAQNCSAGTKCVAVDGSDTSWGFCGACVPDGNDCLADTDCCNANSSCGILGTCG